MEKLSNDIQTQLNKLQSICNMISKIENQITDHQIERTVFELNKKYIDAKNVQYKIDNKIQVLERLLSYFNSCCKTEVIIHQL